MGQDPPRRPSQQGFHNTFGQGRNTKRDSIQGNSQRAADDVAPSLNRTRTVNRPDERSPVGQRDRLERSDPTTLVSHRQRYPENLNPHSSSQLSKVFTSQVSGVSLKPMLNLFCKKITWYKARMEAEKYYNKLKANEQQSHYRPSDYASSPGMLAAQQKQALEEIQKAERIMGECDDGIASAMPPFLQHISEAWGKSPDPSKASEEQAISEVTMNTIQNTIKKEMEESFKKEATESQRVIQELVESQMVKLKEVLTQENERKLHSLQKVLAQEAEDRATSLRKTLKQENEKRVAEMKESINREHNAIIAKLENSLSEEAKNKDRIAELEKALSEEAKNKDRIVELEKTLSEEANHKVMIIAQLEKIQFEQEEKNAAFSKRVAWVQAGLEKAESGQKLLEESLIDKRQLTAFDDKMAKQEARLRETLSEQRVLLESLVDKSQLDQQLQQLSISQDEKFGKLEARVNLFPDHSPKIMELVGQICDHSRLIEENEQQQDKANRRLESQAFILSNLRVEGEGIKERVRKLGSNNLASVSDNKILEVVKPELEKNIKDTREMTKEMVMKVHNKLRPFIEQERYKLDTQEEQIGDNCRQISEIRRECATIKADYSRSMEELRGQIQLKLDELRQIEEKIHVGLGLVRDDFRSRLEGVYIQVQTLNQWQTNFDTKGLYRDMIAHINRTIPEPQIKLLKQQVSGIETRIAAWENVGSKKRKLLNGNAKVVNGHQTGT